MPNSAARKLVVALVVGVFTRHRGTVRVGDQRVVCAVAGESCCRLAEVDSGHLVRDTFHVTSW